MWFGKFEQSDCQLQSLGNCLFLIMLACMICKNDHYKVHEIDTIISSKVLLKNVHRCRLAGVFFFFFLHQQLMATNGPSYWCYGTMATKKVLLYLHSEQQLEHFFLPYVRSSILKHPNLIVVRWIIPRCCRFRPRQYLTPLLSSSNIRLSA